MKFQIHSTLVDFIRHLPQIEHQHTDINQNIKYLIFKAHLSNIASLFTFGARNTPLLLQIGSISPLNGSNNGYFTQNR